ncbi:FlgD immunoglobulin-like domain containing protein [Kribbella qitaiheensis]|uniref:FlgD immunoglobulin-like domain containing protein n=1 Tax=Kribbella qitaiheensis TaxID=1544730 RepID=UPI003607A38D
MAQTRNWPRDPLNVASRSWKACWGQPLTSSNLVSSATPPESRNRRSEHGFGLYRDERGRRPVASAIGLLLVQGLNSASPARGFTDSLGGVRIDYRLSGSAADVAIRISGSRGKVRTIDVPQAPPGKDRVERWDGLTNSGRPLGDGTYRVVVAVTGGNQKDAGSIEPQRHFFPVRAPHRNEALWAISAHRATTAECTRASTSSPAAGLYLPPP